MSMIVNPYSGAGGTPGDPSFSQVVALLHCNGANGSNVFTNEVSLLGRGTTFAAAGTTAEVSTTSQLFGTGCMLLANGSVGTTGTGVPADYIFGNNDFTIECALNTTSPSQTAALMEFRDNVGGQGPQLGIFGGQYFIFNTAGLFQAFGTVSTSAYDQIAYSRVAGTGYCFQAGILLATVADTTNYTNGSGFCVIGAAFNSLSPLTGRLDEIRATNGTGRYTTNYTPDVTPFSNF